MTGNDVAVLLSFLAAAIALAGFAGIVTSIDRGAAAASDEVISLRVNNLVQAAVLSVALALLPILLNALELFASHLWQFACMVLAVGVGAFVAHAALAFFRVRKGQGRGLSSSVFVTSVSFGALAFAVALLGTAGIIASRGAYFFGLFYLLYFMCIMFYRMIAMADEAARRKALASTPR